MEKKLKKVQRGASVGFVLLKILRILLIVAAVLTIISLVVLAVVNENDLPLSVVKEGKLELNIQSLDLILNQLGQDKLSDVGDLVQGGVLTLDLKDAKLSLMLLVAAGLLAMVAVYVLMLVAGNLFKHMKNEDTPFTAGNVRRLRLLGIFHIVFWICGIALSYFVSCELIRRLGLPIRSVALNLSLSRLLLSLIYFLLARVFSFGRAQGEALQEYLPAPAPEAVAEPVPEAVAEPAPEPEPVYEAPAPEPVKPEPVYAPAPEAAAPVAEEPAPLAEPVSEDAPVEASEAPAEPEA